MSGDGLLAMCFIPLDLNFGHIYISFKLFFSTNVSNHCEEHNIKLLINDYMKILRNLGINFLNFWQFVSTFLAFQRAILQYSTRTIGTGLHNGRESDRGPTVSRKPRKPFRPVKLYLVHLYLKPERCIRLKLV